MPEPQNSLRHDIALALSDEKLHDVSFTTKDHTTRTANRSLLAIRSHVFRSMLYGGMREAVGTAEIQLPETTDTQLSAVIEFVYTDHISSLSLENVMEISHAADYFALSGMQWMITEFIKEHVQNGRMACVGRSRGCVQTTVTSR